MRGGRRSGPSGPGPCILNYSPASGEDTNSRDLPASFTRWYQERARMPVSTNRIITTDVRDGPMREKAQFVSAGTVAVMARLPRASAVSRKLSPDDRYLALGYCKISHNR